MNNMRYLSLPRIHASYWRFRRFVLAGEPGTRPGTNQAGGSRLGDPACG